ncbi:hydroxyethylthiazole kinase [Campylobacter sp. FMV-PI01]|uniref:Hydroxyethylthiazole kinase n=1 Tax=Campylobacter portucalensis TaxID=2608384 RepID=A0A6L5WG73_9BACT|nr:hydroxyethylthiazole kinase [Campylobacter portucalensis]MSN96148.1 hydroxyethylthiazole kinase [Campylobacter portucalensis]
MKNFLNNIREKKPLIHCITNYVTANDVANSLIGVGASPIMADEFEEVSDITKISNALLVNLGTLNLRTIKSMKLALKTANENNIITVLDPVGVGASGIRNKTAIELIENFKFSVIRGNISEIKFLNGEDGVVKGVDANLADLNDDLNNKVRIAKSLSKKTGAVVMISGKIDVISDCENSYICKNGTSMMSDVSGSGCMLGGIVAAFCAANDENLKASLMAVGLMGLAGEFARGGSVLSAIGNFTFKNNLIDEIYLMDDEKLQNGIKIEKFY